MIQIIKLNNLFIKKIKNSKTSKTNNINHFSIFHPKTFYFLN